MFSALDKRLRKHNIKSKSQLKELLVAEWQQISPDITRKLVRSMENRLNEVLKLKGFPTKY